MAKLEGLWPEAQPHLKIADVREWFASYVYLPKLRDPAVLESAIGEGVSSADPQFAYADGFDEGASRYRGLHYGRMAPTVFSPEAVLVDGPVARRQIDGDSAAVPGLGGIVGAPVGGTSGGSSTPTPPSPTRPTRFFGSVELDPNRPIRSFEAVFNAVIAQLQSAAGTRVRLTLEIEADASPGGFRGGPRRRP